MTERVGTTGAFWPDEVARWLGGLAGPAAADVVRSFGWEPAPDATQAALRALKQIAEAERPGVLERLRQAAGGERSKERELLDWDEIHRLSRGGISFESHGATHAILTRVEQNEDVQRELGSSRETLRARGLGTAELLAYPSGAHDERVRGFAKEAGYRAAFATRLGLATSRCDRWALPRIGLHEDVSSTRGAAAGVGDRCTGLILLVLPCEFAQPVAKGSNERRGVLESKVFPSTTRAGGSQKSSQSCPKAPSTVSVDRAARERDCVVESPRSHRDRVPGVLRAARGPAHPKGFQEEPREVHSGIHGELEGAPWSCVELHEPGFAPIGLELGHREAVVAHGVHHRLDTASTVAGRARRSRTAR